jgi:hypothetical protein
MANLIITIIAIALVAVAALMGAYYGGTAFNQGQDRARASALMNQAAQIQAAVQLLIANENETVATVIVADLDGTTYGDVYMAALPVLENVAWAFDGAGNVNWPGAGVITEEMCDVINTQNGFTVNDVAGAAANCAAVLTDVDFAL